MRTVTAMNFTKQLMDTIDAQIMLERKAAAFDKLVEQGLASATLVEPLQEFDHGQLTDGVQPAQRHTDGARPATPPCAAGGEDC